jgi:DNA-binding response OmpR family regulator
MSMSHTILAIEDHADIRRLIRMTLEFKHYKVLEAANGEDGLALARSAKPDLILLDVMMPGIDGLAVGKIMSTDVELCRIPVIMLSAKGQVQDVRAGLATGVKAYLVKPFSPWELMDQVRNLIAQVQASD